MTMKQIEAIGPDRATTRVQRGFYGVAETDVWNLDWYFLEVIRNGLETLLSGTQAWPDTDEYPTFESWLVELEYRSSQAELLLNEEQVQDDILYHTVGDVLSTKDDPYRLYYEHPEREDEYRAQLSEFEKVEAAVQRDLFGWLGRNLHLLWS